MGRPCRSPRNIACEFFVSYNKQRGKKFRVTRTGGPKKAIEFVKAGIKAYKKDKDK
jgi:hypothetical protein